jgi:hypothetical protein
MKREGREKEEREERKREREKECVKERVKMSNRFVNFLVLVQRKFCNFRTFTNKVSFLTLR